MKGKRLNTGDTFTVITKRQLKGYHWYDSPRFHLLKEGEHAYFEKGKRKYLCEVLGIIQTTVGRWDIGKPIRYWQFTYKVKVLEN